MHMPLGVRKFPLVRDRCRDDGRIGSRVNCGRGFGEEVFVQRIGIIVEAEYPGRIRAAINRLPPPPGPWRVLAWMTLAVSAKGEAAIAAALSVSPASMWMSTSCGPGVQVARCASVCVSAVARWNVGMVTPICMLFRGPLATGFGAVDGRFVH